MTLNKISTVLLSAESAARQKTRNAYKISVGESRQESVMWKVQARLAEEH